MIFFLRKSQNLFFSLHAVDRAFAHAALGSHRELGARLAIFPRRLGHLPRQGRVAALVILENSVRFCFGGNQLSSMLFWVGLIFLEFSLFCFKTILRMKS
jgi:hypothetical protein